MNICEQFYPKIDSLEKKYNNIDKKITEVALMSEAKKVAFEKDLNNMETMFVNQMVSL